jgi:hypothetical protein
VEEVGAATEVEEAGAAQMWKRKTSGVAAHLERDVPWRSRCVGQEERNMPRMRGEPAWR